MGLPRQPRLRAGLLLLCCIFSTSTLPAAAENLNGALTRAFRANPALNAQRRGTSATQELTAQARAGYWPKLSASADARLDVQSGQLSIYGANSSSTYQTRPRGYGLQLTQTLFDGNRTANTVRRAGAQAEGASQTLRNIEQATLFDAASTYTAVLRDRDIVDLNRRGTEFLLQQLNLVRQRHGFGDVTQADVAQATARHAGGMLRLNAAQQALRESSALYRQVIGIEPGSLAPPRPADQFVPRDLEKAMALALRSHPVILAAGNAFAASRSQVDIVAGEFFPTVSVKASVARRYDASVQGDSQLGKSIMGQISIPIFDGGDIASRSRQAREVAGQRQLEEDVAREQVRSAVTTSWGQYVSSKTQLLVGQTQLQAATRELSDATQQYRYGQKSLIDVLNAQQDLLDAGTNLIVARRERVLATFAVARATGRLTLDALDADLDDRAGPGPAIQFPGSGTGVLRPAIDANVSLASPAVDCSGCLHGGDRFQLRPGLNLIGDAPSKRGLGLRTTIARFPPDLPVDAVSKRSRP